VKEGLEVVVRRDEDEVAVDDPELELLDDTVPDPELDLELDMLDVDAADPDPELEPPDEVLELNPPPPGSPVIDGPVIDGPPG
jgi:hypothetical protein